MQGKEIQTVEQIKEIFKEKLGCARNKIIKQLDERKIDDLEIVKRGGSGVNGKYDRSLYYWITVYYKGKEYGINLFLCEIDSDSGNCHIDIGRIMFTKDYIYNKSKTITSPNEIIKFGNKWSTDDKATLLIFNSYKWVDPITYLKGIEENELMNKKWITVDDILENNDMTDKLVEAFKSFIETGAEK